MKILAIKRITTKAGKSLVLVSTANQDVFITAGQWKSAGASASLDNYVGGNIDARYFEEGEELFDGTECTESGKILDSFSVSANPAVLAHALAIESSLKETQAMDLNALFARKRAEDKAKAIVEPKAEKALA